MIREATVTWEGWLGLEEEVARLGRGELDALEALLGRYQHRLYRYLLRMVRQPATAEDLFQQTWLRVAANIRRYDPRRSFEAWLFAVARNLAIDHLRRRAPESLEEPAGEGPSAADRLTAPGADALERLLVREQAELLAAAMAELPAIYREVLTLRFEEEMKLEEIAAVTAAPISTVKTRLRRALEALRRGLEPRIAGMDLG
jgi:RNA polymerase sigma-70 factor, ECF subfamily